MRVRWGFLAVVAAVVLMSWPAQAHHKPVHHHGPTTTTLPATTTTTEPMPTSTTVRMGDASRLQWAPPSLTTPTTIEVGEGSALGAEPATINLTAGQDYVIDWVGKTTRRVRIAGGRNRVIIGAEVDINSAHASNDDRNALWFDGDGSGGTIHVEGLYAHGAFINDGIKGNDGDAVWQVQNSRVDELQGTDAGYHADVFQPFGGFQALRIDKVTGYSQYQGLMMKADGNRWLTTDIRRLNLGQYLTPDSVARTVNLIGGPGPNGDGNPYMEGPVHLGDQFYLQPRTTTLSSSIAPAAWFTFSGSGGTELATPNPAGWASSNPGMTIDGTIKEGLPPGGDYVPVGVAGLSYVSPGYL